MRPLRVETLRARDRERLVPLWDGYLEGLAALGAAYRRRADGRWEYRPPGGDWGTDHLPYWLAAGDDHRVLVFRLGLGVVGFAMVGLRPAPWMSPGTDACIAEFYVAPAMRRRGIGQAAALRILSRWDGRWEISEVPGNLAAIAFWRKILDRFTAGAYEELELPGGLTQRFTTLPPRPRATHRARVDPSPRGGARRRRATRTSRGGARAPRR